MDPTRRHVVLQLAEVALPRALLPTFCAGSTTCGQLRRHSQHEERGATNVDPGSRGAAMIDQELPKRTQKASASLRVRL